jgi:hypothetical protein
MDVGLPHAPPPRGSHRIFFPFSAFKLGKACLEERFGSPYTASTRSGVILRVSRASANLPGDKPVRTDGQLTCIKPLFRSAPTLSVHMPEVVLAGQGVRI